MSWLTLLVGQSIGQRVVILGTVLVYLWLLARDPSAAREGAAAGLTRLAQLATLIVAALFLARAIGALIPRSAVASLLGSAAGPQGVVLAGLLGGLIPGGPYAVYPIVHSIGKQGAPLAAVIAMLVGYGAIGIGRLPYDLVFFEGRTVGARLLVGVIGTAAVALLAVVVL